MILDVLGHDWPILAAGIALFVGIAVATGHPHEYSCAPAPVDDDDLEEVA